MSNHRIEIHIIAFNEEIMLPFTIAHYRRMFKDPLIVVHDNNSTDQTIAIAAKNGCQILPFTTDGMNDTLQSQIKSEAAMKATSDWVLCIDADEECLITDKDLDELEQRGVNIVRFDGWNIFDEVQTPWEIKIPMGVPCSGYSKPVLLRTGIFSKIEFAAGAHSISVEGPAIWSAGEFKLLHYKHWSCQWNINRSAALGGRQSQENINNNHSYHFRFPKEVHEDYFRNNFNQRETIIDERL